jgi:hypothetical protein
MSTVVGGVRISDVLLVADNTGLEDTSRWRTYPTITYMVMLLVFG